VIKRFIHFIALFIFALFISACTIQPKVELVSEQTALERQLLGRYSDLDEKALFVAPLRSMQQGSDAMHDYRRALAGRAYRFDELQAWLNQGLLFEADDGLIHIRDGKRPEMHADRFAQLVQKENADRGSIIDLVIRHSAEFSEADKSRLAALFYQLRRKELAPGNWVRESGRLFQISP